jgi:hypothetical protein
MYDVTRFSLHGCRQSSLRHVANFKFCTVYGSFEHCFELVEILSWG